MKNMKTLTIVASLVSLSLFAQTNIEKLPSFYDQSEGNKVISVDMVGDGIDPIVLYTTYNHNEIKCKTWDGQEWVAYGAFPAIEKRGYVNIELYKGNAYALVQAGEGWSLFERKNNSEKWVVFGNAEFAESSVFATPTLTFIEGNPIVYERHYREDKVTMYKYQNGKFYNLAGVGQLTDVSDDFRMVSNQDDKMVMAWTTSDKGDLKLFEINKSGEETTEKTITKGLKTKEIKEIQDLFYHKGSLFLYYLNSSWELQVAKYNESSAKWEMNKTTEVIDGLGFYQANDLSFVSKSRENDLPVFYKYNVTTWAPGIEVGTEKIFHGREVKLAEGLGEYYLLNFNAKGGTIIQKFTLD